MFKIETETNRYHLEEKLNLLNKAGADIKTIIYEPDTKTYVIVCYIKPRK